MSTQRVIAYFSMEIALEAGIPTYSGGLGVLAGDTLRSSADLEIPMVGVTLLYRRGHFHQKIDANGWQGESPEEWTVEEHLKEVPPRVSVMIEGRDVHLRAWQYEIQNAKGYIVPVYFLDADLPENAPQDRSLTHTLYGGDDRYRLCQEVILGVGGVRMLRALGYTDIKRFHMNEGHSSLLTLELADEEARKAGRTHFTSEDIEAIRKLCVFTTHTPIPAGHDQFPLDLANQIIGRPELAEMKNVFCCDQMLNMTYLALNLSHYVNGVARKHGEITRLMFAEYTIDAITNGVHVPTWTSKPFQELFDQYLFNWREDNFNLRYALNIPLDAIWDAHTKAKRHLMDTVNETTQIGLDPEVFTIGFARRATAYKRADLLFRDLDRLRQIASETGPFQILYAGKAHPNDQGGKEIIRNILLAKEALKDKIKVAYLENYNLEIAKRLTSGVDLWLNTPQPPLEASGTSGMKAALNGIPSLSVLDGWWIEGYLESATGWTIGELKAEDGKDRSAEDAASLYEKLEKVILPMYYRKRNRFISMMCRAIALNGSFFHTHRMLRQYVLNAYFRD